MLIISGLYTQSKIDKFTHPLFVVMPLKGHSLWYCDRCSNAWHLLSPNIMTRECLFSQLNNFVLKVKIDKHSYYSQYAYTLFDVKLVSWEKNSFLIFNIVRLQIQKRLKCALSNSLKLVLIFICTGLLYKNNSKYFLNRISFLIRTGLF